MKPKPPTPPASERPKQPDVPPAEQARDQGYYASIGRNGTEDEITIHAPDGREMAHIWFWDEEHGEPGVGDKEAKAAGRLIVDALNAYRPGHSLSSDSDARSDTAKRYHASPGRIPYDFGDSLDIRAPDGRTMAFIGLSQRLDKNEMKVKSADAQLITDALNAYEPKRAHTQPQRVAQTEKARDEQRRIESFHAVIASYKNSDVHFYNDHGDSHQWQQLSAKDKVSYITGDAARADVPFEHFAKAVRDVLADQPSAAREEAALRVALDDRRENRALRKLAQENPTVSRRWQDADSIERFERDLQGEKQDPHHLYQSLDTERKVRFLAKLAVQHDIPDSHYLVTVKREIEWHKLGGDYADHEWQTDRILGEARRLSAPIRRDEPSADPDVFARNGHRSAQEPPEKSQAAPAKEPEPPRRRH